MGWEWDFSFLAVRVNHELILFKTSDLAVTQKILIDTVCGFIQTNQKANLGQRFAYSIFRHLRTGGFVEGWVVS